MGVDMYDLFASMVADRSYEDIMDKGKANNLKGRMQIDYSEEAKIKRYKTVMEKYDEIN